jgi:hypothetical protein
MSGWMMVYSNCFGCGRYFGYNPEHVPSIPIMADGSVGAGGDRKPICNTCIHYANERRKASGLPLWSVHPEAYEATEAL